jgi:hypothetical protein
MKYHISIEDTFTANGPGVDVRVLTDPPLTTHEEILACGSLAVTIGQAALSTIHHALQVGAKMAGPTTPPEIQLDVPRNAPE